MAVPVLLSATTTADLPGALNPVAIMHLQDHLHPVRHLAEAVADLVEAALLHVVVVAEQAGEADN